MFYKNLLIIPMFIFFCLETMASCKLITKKFTLNNSFEYKVILDECGIRPVVITTKLPIKSTRKDLVNNLVTFFSSEMIHEIEGNYFDSARMVRNLNNINLKKWYRLNKNYEFCSNEIVSNACNEFIRLKFRNGNLHLTYNRH